jgi:uncharacterized membrane protein
MMQFRLVNKYDNYINEGRRIFELDFSRGVAVILMVIFHICYDLNHFGFVNIEFRSSAWEVFRTVIVTLFFLVVGMSLVMAHGSKIIWEKYFRKLSILFACAIAVTVATYFVFPTQWIYFGVLHFIFTANLVGILFTNMSNLSFVIGLSIFAVYFSTDMMSMEWLYNTLKPVLQLPDYTVDIVGFFPSF